MTVWELMAALSKCPAGSEVIVSMHSTEHASIVSFCESTVSISGGDAQLLDDNGDLLGKLSELAEVSDDDDEE